MTEARKARIVSAGQPASPTVLNRFLIARSLEHRSTCAVEVKCWRMADTLPGSITIVCSLTGPSPTCVGDRTDKPLGLGFNSDQQEPANALDYRGIRPEQRLYLI